MTSGNNIVQKGMQKSTDFLRRIIAPVQVQGCVALSYAYPIATVCHWKIASGGSLGSIVTASGVGRTSATGCARGSVASAVGWTSDRVLVIREGVDPSEAKVFRVRAPP